MSNIRLISKRALGAACSLARPFRRLPNRWVLTFHEVGNHSWGLRPLDFEAILDALATEMVVVPLQDLLTGSTKRKTVSLTFDDAYEGIALHALPALRRRSMAATVFVPTDLPREVAGVPPQDRGLYPGARVLGWKEIRGLSTDPLVSFQSHGAAHASLPDLDPRAQEQDLWRSMEALAAATGRRPVHLAYPFGDFDSTATAAARAAGFSAAFSTIHGGIQDGEDPFAMPRVDVRGGYGAGDVLRALRGDWDWLAMRHRAALKGRRAVRNRRHVVRGDYHTPCKGAHGPEEARR